MLRDVGLVSLATIGLTALLAAQVPETQGQAASPGVQFLAMSARGPVPVEVSTVPVLRRKVSVAFAGVTLEEALAEIEGQARVQFAYSRAQVPLGTRITLRAEGMTVAAVLTELLLDARVDVVVSPGSRLALIQHLPPGSSQRTGTVSGRVTDAKTGQGVGGARVTLEGTSFGALTDESGGFWIIDVAVGTYTVTARRIGYAHGVGFVTVAADEEAVVDVRLELSASPLDAVVVTGTAFATNVRTVPNPISVITAKEIEEKQSTNITDLLRGEIPGVMASTGGQNDYISNIYVRGNASWSTNDYIKMYVDGVEVAQPNYVATIDPNNIERIEVVRGPQASTIYGSEAASGVVQIFTKKGRNNGLSRPRIELKTSAGVIESDYKPADVGAPTIQEHGLSVSGGSHTFSYHTSGTYLKTGEWLKHYGSKTLSFSAGLRAVQGPFTAEFSAAWSDRDHDYAMSPIFWRYPASSACIQCGNPDGFFTNEWALSQNTMGLNLTFLATPKWQHTLILGDDQNRAGFYQPAPNRFTPADTFVQLSQNEYRRRSIRYNTAYDAAFGNSVTARFSLGGDYWSYDVQGSFGSNLLSALGTVRTSSQTSPFYQNDRWWNAGYFGMAELGFREQLFLTLATRVEENPNFGDAYGRAVSPRVGVAYVHEIAPVLLKARAAWGRGTRPPSARHRAGSTSATTVYLPNPDIGPEEKAGWDAGLEVYWGRHASVAVTRFDEEGKNLIQGVDIDLTSTPTIRQYQNIGRVGSWGWELEGTMNVGRISLRANYAIANSVIMELSNQYTASPNSSDQVGDRTRFVPKHSGGGALTGRFWRGSASVNMSVMDNWRALDYRAYYGYLYGGEPYRGSMRAYYVEYPALVKWNLRAEQALSERFAAFLRVDNLTNNQERDGDNWGVAQGRTTVAGVRMTY